MRDIGYLERVFFELVFDRVELFFLCFDMVAHGSHRCHGIVRGLFVSLELGHFFRAIF